METHEHTYHTGDRLHEEIKREAREQGTEISQLVKLAQWYVLRRLRAGVLSIADLENDKGFTARNRDTDIAPAQGIDTAEKRVYDETVQAGGQENMLDLLKRILGMEVYTVEQAAAEANVTTDKIYKRIQRGKLDAAKVGRDYLLTKEQVEALKQEQER